MFVLGIDPGLTRCGYGLVESTSSDLRAIAAGVIRTAVSTDPGDGTAARLAELQQSIRALLAEFEPTVVAVERIFFQTNAQTAMSVAQASGVILAEVAASGRRVALYTPNEVKATVAGAGAAAKEQVQRMVQRILGLAELPRPADAADALALAITHHAHHRLTTRIATR